MDPARMHEHKNYIFVSNFTPMDSGYDRYRSGTLNICSKIRNKSSPIYNNALILYIILRLCSEGFPSCLTSLIYSDCSCVSLCFTSFSSSSFSFSRWHNSSFSSVSSSTRWLSSSIFSSDLLAQLFWMTILLRSSSCFLNSASSCSARKPNGRS